MNTFEKKIALIESFRTIYDSFVLGQAAKNYSRSD